MLPSVFYKHSGKAPLGGIVFTLAGGLIGGVLLGALYGFLIYWCPFVYVNVFMTIGFGIGLAMVVGTLGVIGKIRSVAVISVLALIVSAAAYYVHWAVWFGRIEGATQALTLEQLWVYLSAVAALGPWNIFGWTPTGASLWTIWGIEAFMIMGMATVSARGSIDIPFCETTDQWAIVEALPQHFKPVDSARAPETPRALLDALEPLEDPSATHSEVEVATVENSELRCVSLKTVEVTIKDDKAETKDTEIVKYMLFDRHSFDQLMKLAQPATV